MGDKGMPPVEVQKDQLKKIDLQYMKLIEKQNIDRVLRLQRNRKRNIITGCTLGLGVMSIYLYSIYAVQQEKFLDDFKEPEKTKVYN